MEQIHAFDLDRTLLRCNSSVSFCYYLRRKKVLPMSSVMLSGLYYVRHHFLGLSLKELHHSIFERVLRGQSLQLLEGYVDQFVRSAFISSLYLPAFNRLREAQQKGHYTIILSNSPSFLVKGFAKLFNVHEFQATEYDVDEERKLSRIARILEGEDKATYLKKLIAKWGLIHDKVTAYSDSILDLAFLQTAGEAVAVNPDRKLRALSLKKNWRII